MYASTPKKSIRLYSLRNTLNLVTGKCGYEKECFSSNVYFESNEAFQLTYLQPYRLYLIP